MAKLTSVSFDKKQFKKELKAFGALLNDPTKPNLKERSDLLPFFRQHPNLCAAMARYNPNSLGLQNLGLSHEFDIFGDHVADLVVGDIAKNYYCFIEFEDATETSIFKKTPKQTPEWSARYEHGFSQLVDWTLWLENNVGTPAFQNRFNAKAIRYNMLLIIGRDRHLASHGLRERMEWRSEQVVVASKHFNCITYDQLYDDLMTIAKASY